MTDLLLLLLLLLWVIAIADQKWPNRLLKVQTKQNTTFTECTMPIRSSIRQRRPAPDCFRVAVDVRWNLDVHWLKRPLSHLSPLHCPLRAGPTVLAAKEAHSLKSGKLMPRQRKNLWNCNFFNQSKCFEYLNLNYETIGQIYTQNSVNKLRSVNLVH